MDGKQLTQAVLDNIDSLSRGEKESKQRRIYECLDQAAAIFCREARCLHATAALTTVAAQQDYDLPPDFIDLYLTAGSRDRRIVRYYDGTDTFWPPVIPWERIFTANLTDHQETPATVAIRDKETSEALIAGTATAAGAAVRGLSILTDSAKLFITTNRVWPRDIIHNETDQSDGYVIEVTDATHLKTALFNGNKNAWTSADAYTIIPATEKQLTLEAPAETAGHIITVPYVSMPSPVYSDYGVWRFDNRVCRGIAAGAAALMQMPENSYDESRVMMGLFADELRRARVEIAQAILRNRRR